MLWTEEMQIGLEVKRQKIIHLLPGNDQSDYFPSIEWKKPVKMLCGKEIVTFVFHCIFLNWIKPSDFKSKAFKKENKNKTKDKNQNQGLK